MERYPIALIKNMKDEVRISTQVHVSEPRHTAQPFCASVPSTVK